MKLHEFYITENPKPKLIALHYFNISSADFDNILMQQTGLKKDRSGILYLPQYDTSGSKFDRTYSSLLNHYGLKKTIKVN